MKEIAEIVREWRRRPSEMFALATLVRVRGSSYRRRGARMLVANDGRAVGSLSGGCLEEEVALLAQDVMRTDRPKLVPFDMRRRFGCNGQIEIFIERPEKFLFDLAEHIEARQTCTALTNFEDMSYSLGTRIIGAGEQASGRAFIQQIDPLIQLIIIGGGHDTIPFRALSELLGWSLLETESVSELPDKLDAWTAVVVKTHNYGRDFSALRMLVPLGLRYLGLIGPRRRRDQLLADLFDVTGPIDAELFSPAGLDLGAETPQEIALAIVAEIQSIFAAASCESLRNRKAPIHAISYNLSDQVHATR
jgi:xanthine/CO dehydrogenase XdhC/CoxF family maturation factor